MPENYETLSPEEIEAELQDLSAQKDELREKMRSLNQVRDKRLAQVSAQAKLEAMSPQERAALGLPEPQAVKPNGVDSEETVSEV